MAAPTRRPTAGADRRATSERRPADVLAHHDGGGRDGASLEPRAARLLDLQRDAGNRAVTGLLGERAGGRAAGSVAVQRRPSRKDRQRRERATRLRAADARTLLGERLPYALARMSESQVGQIQKVFDASVVNPDVQAEAAVIDKKSIIASSGGYTNRDPNLVAKADRVREQGLVPVGDSDKRVRMDAMALLAPDALKPRSDNPDEGNYLARVQATLESRGVYLRVAAKRVRDPEDPSQWIIDPRQFEAWLSLGPTGDTIPTQDGQITREAIMKTTVLGAGYYENVDQGPAQRAIDRETKRLQGEIEAGLYQHRLLQKIRNDAFIGVAEVSDLLGGADFPDMSIWDRPHKLLMRAMGFNVGGNIASSQVFLVFAAMVTRNAAQLLAEYLENSNAGVERTVTVLKVAKRAGQIAEVGLALTGVGVIARGSRVAATEVGAGSVESLATKLGDRYIARNGLAAEELGSTRFVPMPKGSVAGGVKPGTSSGAGTGFHRY